MRILCKGFNLYGQLNGTDKCVADFRAGFEHASAKHFHLGHTFSINFITNTLNIYCNKNHIELVNNIGKVKQTAISDKLILILNDNGQLFKIPIDDLQLDILPKFVDTNDQIKTISSNSKLSVAYTETGHLYNIPEKLDFVNKNIIEIKTGREHCVLLDESGNVYTFGAGSRGQLGTGLLDDHPNPVLVEALAGIKISKIAAGGWHSGAISEEGDLYMWGWNGNGQLGLGFTEQTVSVMATPHVVDIQGCAEYRAVQVTCGSKHTIVLLDNNILYGCGWNQYKQIKNDHQEEHHSFIFIHNFSNEKIEKITCGPWNTAVICK